MLQQQPPQQPPQQQPAQHGVTLQDRTEPQMNKEATTRPQTTKRLSIAVAASYICASQFSQPSIKNRISTIKYWKGTGYLVRMLLPINAERAEKVGIACDVT